MYKVVKAFHDLQDGKKTKSGEIYFEYKVGDVYPRKGLSPSKGRIAELAGSENKQGTPLIALVEEPKETEVDEEQFVMEETESDAAEVQPEEAVETSEKPVEKKTASKKRNAKISEK